METSGRIEEKRSQCTRDGDVPLRIDPHGDCDYGVPQQDHTDNGDITFLG
jgi:hypothetical protein